MFLSKLLPLFYSCHLFCVCRQCKQHSLSDCMVPQRSESLRWKIKALVSFHPTTNRCWNENNENPTSALDWIWIESLFFFGSWLTDLTVYGFVWCWFWWLRMIFVEFCGDVTNRKTDFLQLKIWKVQQIGEHVPNYSLQSPVKKMEDIKYLNCWWKKSCTTWDV